MDGCRPNRQPLEVQAYVAVQMLQDPLMQKGGQHVLVDLVGAAPDRGVPDPCRASRLQALDPPTMRLGEVPMQGVSGRTVVEAAEVVLREHFEEGSQPLLDVSLPLEAAGQGPETRRGGSPRSDVSLRLQHSGDLLQARPIMRGHRVPREQARDAGALLVHSVQERHADVVPRIHAHERHVVGCREAGPQVGERKDHEKPHGNKACRPHGGRRGGTKERRHPRAGGPRLGTC
mmetsp:Transcript_59925/g.173545  ORF Transcript_59925/g.173545 Transcript_59925/m.173545 type:complete len:232 (+) Transcript_59925:1223-1918(+)